MRFFLALLVFPGLVIAYQAFLKSAFSKENSETVLKALGTGKCLRNCLTNLTQALGNVDDGKLSETLNNLCSAYKETTECIKKKFCGGQMAIDITLSGLKEACGARRQIFKTMEKCLDEKASTVYDECELKCGLENATMTVLESEAVQKAVKRGGGPLLVAKAAGPLCQAAICTFPCLYTELNKVCPLSGHYIVDTLLTPLDKGVRFMEAVHMGNLARRRAPQECAPLLDRRGLAQLHLGKTPNPSQFVNGISFLATGVGRLILLLDGDFYTPITSIQCITTYSWPSLLLVAGTLPACANLSLSLERLFAVRYPSLYRSWSNSHKYVLIIGSVIVSLCLYLLGILTSWLFPTQSLSRLCAVMDSAGPYFGTFHYLIICKAYLIGFQ
ncbi:unnamed protein product, partial [Mesorhabditis belari]|uniref:Chondroitin proteoglycan 4 domain-containing protein n=1 Tax=Mesorhabditis belari TaxID=2138241 RepID=A0AAF3FD55_9BILA